jgi:separase
VDGPEAVEIQRIKGELFSRQAEGLAADELFAGAVEHLVGLDKEFMSAETKMPSARKDSIMPAAASREPLMPLSLGHLLRQRAWLLREGGNTEEYETILEQLDLVPRTSGGKPEHLLLEARLAMYDAFKYFKTDLFMSSLTESTIALTMGSPGKRGKDRHSTRHEAVLQLERASEAFRNTLSTIAARGRIEDVRQTCVSLALLGAFQTSLGQGSAATTASAAATLASASSIALHRQLLAAIDSKYTDPDADDMDWPVLDPVPAEPADALQAYWADVRARHADMDLLGDYDLTSLPTNWAVVSITVTDDRNTMLVTRHQNGHEAIVFCIPLDRQGRRDGDDESELFTFDAGIAEFQAIMVANKENIQSTRECTTAEERKEWWRQRHALDTRLSELLATVEFCWLGAFKTVLNPRLEFDPDALAAFRTRLDRIFHSAITAGGTDIRKAARVRLNDTLLACFATLSSKCRDEEIEDLVYFVLDLYQFHGIAVAVAELDFDMIGMDVKAALADLEQATGMHENGASDEHLLLALDKNVQVFPWESIPILRGRAVSRIASLPLLLDQVALGATLGADAAHRTIDTRKTSYILNPGKDLQNTQKCFESRLKGLEADGWKGIVGREPTEAEMSSALTESDLVMYYGHGSGEQYLRSHKLRALPRCAATMLWGCSSGRLRDQGDLDPWGPPHDYVLAGSPCLVSSLWDVTDKDIDRVTIAVMDTLGLEAGKLGEGGKMSLVQAVSQGRSAARLPFLTGAAVVVYGVPMYFA